MKDSNGSINFVQKKIRLRGHDPKAAAKIAAEYGLSQLASRVLSARGYCCDDQLANFLNPTLKSGLPPPDRILHLKAACLLIRDVIRAKGSIAICCDFDVDGLTGGAQVYHFFKMAGVLAKVFVPDRFEDGYGLNERMVRRIAEENFALLIAIDYGTTQEKELSLAHRLGLKTIVLDHHHVGTHKPPCDVFINPMQPGCGFAGGVLCASGLSWYLLTQLKSMLSDVVPAVRAIDVRSYLDLACLGTICDMVPLQGVNRVIARRGLELLGATRRKGLVALKQTMGLFREVNCHDVSFGMGPRLNAAGRMVNGEMVIDLLTTDDEELAGRIARELNALNADRQNAEQEVKLEAIRQIQSRYTKTGLPWGLVVSSEEFHTGVVGIVAQRLVELFYRPTVVLGVDSDGMYKGSVRGIKGFSVIDALTATGGHLMKFGGHEGAGGLSVEPHNLEEFTRAFDAECKERLTGIDTLPSAEADAEANLPEITVKLVEELQNFTPFGMGNPNPLVLVRNLKVKAIKDIKSQHLKATLTDGSASIAGMLWRQTSHPALHEGGLVNVVFKPDYSNFNGLTEMQGNLQAIEVAKR